MLERRSRAALGSSVFYILAPGVVAGLIPWWISGWEMREVATPIRLAGVLLIATGVTALTYSFVRFVVEGIGTPAPVAPTNHLVVGGLYRYVRNPMYIAVLIIIIGQSLLLGKWSLIWYSAVAGAAMTAFTHFYEEPALARRFRESYETYRCNVPAWIPRSTPWHPGDRTQADRDGPSIE
jgi:protein-S-isoprenylcysteine O-methyltransferase Ste14